MFFHTVTTLRYLSGVLFIYNIHMYTYVKITEEPQFCCTRGMVGKINESIRWKTRVLTPVVANYPTKIFPQWIESWVRQTVALVAYESNEKKKSSTSDTSLPRTLYRVLINILHGIIREDLPRDIYPIYVTHIFVQLSSIHHCRG